MIWARRTIRAGLPRAMPAFSARFTLPAAAPFSRSPRVQFSSSSTSSSAEATEEGDGGNSKKGEGEASELSELDMSEFGATTSLQAGDLGLTTGIDSPIFDDEFDDVLDPSNPPKLSQHHYELLKGIDWREWAARERSQAKYTRATPTAEDTAHHRRRLSVREIMEEPYFADDAIHTKQRYAEQADSDQLPETESMKQGVCMFCQPDPSVNQIKELVYTNVQLLSQFTNERGMITSRRMNSLCAKHQRKVKKVIKQSREIGLLAFTSDWVATTKHREENNTVLSRTEVADFEDEEDDLYDGFSSAGEIDLDVGEATIDTEHDAAIREAKLKRDAIRKKRERLAPRTKKKTLQKPKWQDGDESEVPTTGGLDADGLEVPPELSDGEDGPGRMR
jgi:ribosomal protein S18